MPEQAPHPMGRDAFLASVSGHLDLPEDQARGILEELADHLRDAADELQQQGVSPVDAERRAVARLGDARSLGSELSRARHTRRQVLAAIGGGAWGLFVEGIRSWVAVALLMVIASVIAIPIAATVIHAQGRSASSYLAGPVGSLLTVVLVLGVVAYLGWVLPARIARAGQRSVHGVRRAVALAGVLAGSVILWAGPQIDLDPVLAVGLPLAPVAFALAAGRAPERPRFRAGFVPAVAGALVICLPLAALAVVSATDSGNPDFEADTARFGQPLDPGEGGAQLDTWTWSEGPTQATIELRDSTIAARFATVSLEMWPARVERGIVEFGSEPIVAASVPVTGTTLVVPYEVPHLRAPVTTVTFAIGVEASGHRTVLAESFDFASTPPWRGTLLDWWAGRP